MNAQTSPDDYGVEPTNLPDVHVLWERHGATITCTMVATEQPSQTPVTWMPRGVKPQT